MVRFSRFPFPPYSYVPGMHPHPVSDPEGHSFAGAAGVSTPISTPTSWREGHLWAVDLFNFGYYWEAHEAWESMWIAVQRVGPRAAFLKGLIKLSAAGVKAREGSTAGVRRHAQRAAELFASIDVPSRIDRSDFGLCSSWLAQQNLWLARRANEILDPTDCPVQVVIPFRLLPRYDDSNVA